MTDLFDLSENELAILQDLTKEHHCPMKLLAFHISMTDTQRRKCCQTLVDKKLATLLPLFDEEGYVRGSGYFLTTTGEIIQQQAMDK